MGFRKFLSFALLQVALFTASSSADCECGYSVNATSTPNHAVFTELWETDFLHLISLGEETGWATQVYNVTAKDARGPYGKSATLNNVVPNPFADPKSWSGAALHGGDPGLQLFVRAGLTSGLIPMGEIDSERTDMLYGSFRIGVKHSSVTGTCGAYFWYRNNSQEIDIEMLSHEFSSNNSTANLVVQSPKSAAQGFNAAGTPDFAQPSLPFDPSQGYHEYRFDWTPTQVIFYIDSQLVDVMTQSVPNSPGKIVMNHWSNGDPKWSGGPPQTDAIMTVMYVKAYFNSTFTHPSYKENCPVYNASAVCTIPDQNGQPILSGNNPPTHFFSTSSEQTKGQTSSNTTWGATGQHNAASARFGDAGSALKVAAFASSLFVLASQLL